MELTYQVPRDAYVDLLESMIRKNDRRPLKMLTALLLTVGQMAAVILLCIFKLEGSQRIFVLVWSVLVAGITRPAAVYGPSTGQGHLDPFGIFRTAPGGATGKSTA